MDKTYITNGIVYTGIGHSINYIYYLVHDFNFKITHYSYSKEQDLNKINKIIKSLDKKNVTINDLFYPKTIIQCIDLSSFPLNFN